jgi:hypothetical protein
MPIYQRNDGKPVVEFDPLLELSPFTLWRRLEEDRVPLLIDVRQSPRGMTLRGAERLIDPAWEPDPELVVLLFDDDGREAIELARNLQARGFDKVRALFGGLQLYEFSLDPEIIGRDTHLVPIERP